MNRRAIRPRCWTAPLCAALVALAAAQPLGASAQTAPGEIGGHRIPVPGEKVEGTTARLSEVEAEMVARMAPQAQAERLLQYAISHHVGATDDLKARAKGWRGAIAFAPALDTLLDVARNGDDLRVRAAAIEVELAAMDIDRTPAQVEALLGQIAADPGKARRAIYILGDLANRGVETDRIHNELRVLTRSDQELIRFQAYAAIAQIGTNETVQDLVDAFHHDPSPMVRIDGGGCGLAHCGMLTRAQRMLAVPRLIEMVEDRSLAAGDIAYGYRALREITDAGLSDNPRLWREWFAAHGAETMDKFRRFEDSQDRRR
jgi:HEAT repeat protein